ncbi:MAG: hypothetical protein ACFFCU_20245 [Promethearchaeota archaeon]
MVGEEVQTEITTFEEIVQRFEDLFNDQLLKLEVDPNTWDERRTWFENTRNRFLERTISPEEFYHQLNRLHMFFLLEVNISLDLFFPFPSFDQLSYYEYTPAEAANKAPDFPQHTNRLGEHYCGNCGANRISDTHFCPDCGYRFPPPLGRPLGIKIIIGLLTVGAILNLLDGFRLLTDPLFGNMYWISFWTLFIGLFQIGTVYGLWRLKPWAGWAVMIIYLLNIFGTIFLAIMFPEAQFDPVIQIVFTIVFAIIIIWYIHAKQEFFN